MRRFAAYLAVFLVASMLSLNSQDKGACSYVVKEVSFENSTGLTTDQLATLKKLVIGRCYDPGNGIFFSDGVYEQLRLWGYRKATVYDPNKFHVLDSSLHPSPIAVVVDFRLVCSDAQTK